MDSLELERNGNRDKTAAAEERAIGTLLNLSLQPLGMESYLLLSVETVLNAAPWLRLLPQGGIFLRSEDGGEYLDLVANYNLPGEISTLCAKVPFGRCLCGRAAEEGIIQFADDLDRRHEHRFEAMLPHSHFCVPISNEGVVIGVLVLYMPAEFHPKGDEAGFLSRIADVLSMGIQRRQVVANLVSAKERAEKMSRRLSTITSNLPGTIFRRVLHTDGSIEIPFISSAEGGTDGVEAAEEWDGSFQKASVLHDDDQARFLAATRESAEALTALNIEYRLIDPNGEIRWVHCRAQPHRQESGATVWDGLLLDVTERKTLEAQLVQAQKLESVGQLAAGIAHEINTPTQYVADNTHFFKESFTDISSLIGAYQKVLAAAKEGSLTPELIAEVEAEEADADLTFLQEEIPSALEQALEGLKKIAVIVSAMKEFSHPGGEDMEMVDVNRIIDNTITVSRNEWKYVAEIETDFATGLPLIPGYRDRLSQVFLNLIVNAAHALETQGGLSVGNLGKIRIVTRLQGDIIEVRISDTGPGVPEALREKIFNPFFTTKDVGKGTGQGLAIARSMVVDKHRGKLELEQEAGTGATFIISLPVTAPDESG